MAIDEPPPPARGLTAEERGSDATAPEQDLAEAEGWPRRLAAAADPRFLLSQADGYPAGVKQFLWFCLVLVYPAWLLLVLLAWPVWVVGKALEALLMVLFWPLRRWMKKHRPDDYAASQER